VELSQALIMEEASAFAPCHVTGFFQIFDESANALNVGSRGAGVSLCQGVKTLVKIRRSPKSIFKVSVNGVVSYSAHVSEHVVKAFRSSFKEMESFEILVDHYTEVPSGAGFGTSGAAALSLALALNKALGLGLSKIEAAQLAHIAEVECKTGLGTVLSETFGGAEIRVKPGAPGVGEIRQIPVPKNAMIASLVFGPLSTKSLLTDQRTRKRVNELGGKLVDKLVKESTTANFLKLSRQFAEHVGLITDKTRSALDLADSTSLVCSMPMFGEAVFTLGTHESFKELFETFRKQDLDGQILVSEIDFEGARVLE
jgi:pantoate kinase